MDMRSPAHCLFLVKVYLKIAMPSDLHIVYATPCDTGQMD